MPTSKRILSMLPEFMQKLYCCYKNKTQIAKWEKQGKPIPVPHAIKQQIVNRYREKHEITTFIESGTYLGDMISAQKSNFAKLYTIELNKDLAQWAKRRFKKDSHVKIIQGDSGKVMPSIVNDLQEKALFWLDGHYSGGITARGDKDCPIVDEVKAIVLSGIQHILIIDDARYFIGERDYPTINGLSSFILNAYPNSAIQIEHDCIIIELEK